MEENVKRNAEEDRLVEGEKKPACVGREDRLVEGEKTSLCRERRSACGGRENQLV